MTISTLDTQLNTLKDELSEKINGSSPYYYSIGKVVRGRVFLDDVENFLPAIWFVVTAENEEGTLSPMSYSVIEIELHGIVAVKTGDMDNLHKLVRDVRYFLDNDYSGQLVGNKIFNYKERGIDDELNLAEFGVVFQIGYTFNITTL